MTDTPTGETVTQGDSQTTVQTDVTPKMSNATEPAEVERLRKEAEQAKMRANQLENELKAKADKEEAERQKQLEENNEWKAIAEQNKAKLDVLEKEREDAVRKIELEDAKKDVLKEFPQEVVDAAEDLGLTLNDNSDDAKEALKAKLTKLSARVTSTNKVSSNNQRTNTNEPSREELLQEYAKTGSQATYDKVLSDLNWVKHSKAINGEG